MSPDKLWNVVTDLDALNEIAGRAVSFNGLPSGRFETGQVLKVSVSLLGLLPRQKYCIKVIEVDDVNRTLLSSESGAGVALWRHTAIVSKDGWGSVLKDQVEIEAGWLTLAASIWATFLYRRRHSARLRILERD